MDPFLRLERANAHERDKRVVFHEKDHFYEIDGKRAGLSVTGFVGRYFSHFDGLATAQKCYPRWEKPRNVATQELLGGTLLKYMRIVEGVDDPSEQRQRLSVIPWMTPSRVESSFGLWQAQEDDKGYYNLIAYLKMSRKLQTDAICEMIASMWTKSGEQASTLGTALHRACECHCNAPEHPDLNMDSKEARMYLRWGFHPQTPAQASSKSRIEASPHPSGSARTTPTGSPTALSGPVRKISLSHELV